MEIPLRVLDQGLYCPPGDFYIDAWKPVPTCVVTHAHGDHAYYGHDLYIASEDSLKIMNIRLGDFRSRPLKYGQKIKLKDTWVSLHPAGHIFGSSQIRIETKNCVTVISGDYKRALDLTCMPFEVIECDIFVTESTFALPIYQWSSNEFIANEIKKWWAENALNGHPSIIFCYALGKSQRLMSLLADEKEKKVHLHGGIIPLTRLYNEMNIDLIPFTPVSESTKNYSFAQDLIIAPPSAMGSPWMKRFPFCRTASASGWMEVRGTRRQRGIDKGFILSDHADWNALINTIEATKAKIILTTHGNSEILAKYLSEEKNLDARVLKGLTNIEEGED
jgi:putative mRNA 3-end processing factor